MSTKYRITPCGCGAEVCKKVFIDNLTHDGRFERPRAEKLVKLLDAVGFDDDKPNKITINGSLYELS